MLRINLFCACGMSTSVLVKNMREEAAKQGLNAKIDAFPESAMNKKLEEGMDIALLGPQIMYKLQEAKALCEPKGVPVEVINSVDYGMMKGDNVLAQALRMAGK